VKTVNGSPSPGPGRGVEIVGLTKSYGPVAAVRGIDIAIAPGETVALLGPNGAGKSTTIDLLLGLQAPDAGTVTIFGTSPSAAVERGAVGAMLQTGTLIRDLDVVELVTMMASLYPHPLAVDEVMAVAGIDDIARRRTQKLSGGQTQRVRFALAIVGDPDLLVLDEPTVALDVEARHGFWRSIRAFAARGKTVVFATHYLEEADASADRIVLLANGKVVADGAATQVKALVGARTIRATLPGVGQEALAGLPGVTAAEVHGDMAVLTCHDSDRALRALLSAYDAARDLEVRGAGLEEAFLLLTTDNAATEEAAR
jgi:ABC-2 type transport system ATP-binding protein